MENTTEKQETQETKEERNRRWNATREKNRKARKDAEKAERLAAEELGKEIQPDLSVGQTFSDPTVGALAIQNTELRIRRVGNQVKYQTPEQMIPVIVEFFDYCMATNTPPLVTTLALALGYCSTHSIDDYLKKPEFNPILTRAKLVCEDYAAKGLIMGKNTVGFIFLLKQYGWKDVQENITTYETHEQRIARLIQQNTGGNK